LSTYEAKTLPVGNHCKLCNWKVPDDQKFTEAVRYESILRHIKENHYAHMNRGQRKLLDIQFRIAGI